MKVRIAVVELGNDRTEFYVEIKNSFFSSWTRLNSNGVSAKELRADQVEGKALHCSFGSATFANQHAKKVVEIALQEKAAKVRRTSYIPMPGI